MVTVYYSKPPQTKLCDKSQVFLCNCIVKHASCSVACERQLISSFFTFSPPGHLDIDGCFHQNFCFNVLF